MPPRQYSRHSFTTGRSNSAEQTYIDDRIPYRFRALTDNKQYAVQEGDSLYALAARYFSPLPRPAGLWWVLADFQPQPIHDPTIQLLPGSVLVIPSVRTVTELILGEERREDTIL